MSKCKYYKQEKYVSYDGGFSWTAMGVYQKGALIESQSEECENPTTSIIYYAPDRLNVTLSAFTPAATAETFSNGVGQIEFAEDVTAIGESAFSGKTAMTRIELPHSVTRIGYYAFYGCSGLTSIEIPDSVTRIDSNAFYNCTSLTSITVNATTPPTFGRILPFGNTNNCPIYVPCESVEAYKTAWRAYADRIQCVNPPTPEYRWTNSGWTCSGASGYDKYNLQVKEVSYDSGSTWSAVTPTETQLGTLIEANSEDCGYVPPVFDGKFSASYSGGQTYSAECDGNTTLTSATTKPSGYQYSAMTEAEIGNCVTSIGIDAFSFCSGLTNVTIGSGVTSIGGSAFYRCSSLTDITIPDSVTSIGNNVFVDCRSLTSITIPSGVTSIGNNVFFICSGLTSITIPNSVTSIGESAFQQCNSLTSINIPSGVTSIEQSTFSFCTSLTSITIPSGVTSIGSYAFYGCSGLTSITIPNSVTSIGQQAFCLCTSLTSVTIPSGVTSIGSGAFQNCSGLTSITVNAITPPTLGNQAFNYTDNCPIYVPSASVDAYKSAWSTYASRIQAIP